MAYGLFLCILAFVCSLCTASSHGTVPGHGHRHIHRGLSYKEGAIVGPPLRASRQQKVYTTLLTKVYAHAATTTEKPKVTLRKTVLVSPIPGEPSPQLFEVKNYDVSTSVAVSAAAAGGSLPTTTWPLDASDATAINVPTAASAQFLGAATQDPATQFINQPAPTQTPLPWNMYAADANPLISSDYPIYPGSGILELNELNSGLVENLKWKPNLSRDGGKGGYLNGEKIFIFCDTLAYGPADQGLYGQGQWVGFVSNTVAVDQGDRAMSGLPLVVQDQMGEWANSIGTPRGFVPLTEGEAAYNNVMAGKGQRYAIWPLSSITPLDATTAIVYASITFTNNQLSPNDQYTYVGNTLLTITNPGPGGVTAQRTTPLLFTGSEPQFGNIGAIRSFGDATGSGGKIYAIASGTNGMLLSRVDAGSVGDRTAYEFWHAGGTWDNEVPSSEGDDVFTKGSFNTADVFYSPRHLTFLMVYQDNFADNKLYWAYLQADKPIKPSYAGGDDEDFVENITKYSWSEPQVLIDIPAPAGGYAYAGGINMGYFEQDDLVNGGSKSLLTWTAPTGQPGGSATTGYQLMSAVVEWQ